MLTDTGSLSGSASSLEGKKTTTTTTTNNNNTSKMFNGKTGKSKDQNSKVSKE